MLGYSLVPASCADGKGSPTRCETYFDYAVRSSRGQSTLDYCREHGAEIGRAYIQHLEEVVTRRFWGVRQTVGELVLVLFGVEVLYCIGTCLKLRGSGKPVSDGSASHTFALAGAALGHYLGPVVLIASDAPTHYILVAWPLFMLVAARCVARLADLAIKGLNHFGRAEIAWPFIPLAVSVLIGPNVCSYGSAIERLRDLQQLSVEQQAAVNALHLEGKRVACRNMSWFVDQDVETFLLPYATVPELEDYVRDHNLDGILIWENEPTPFFKATPYGSVAALESALHESTFFDSPRVSGTWCWYPVRRTATAKE